MKGRRLRLTSEQLDQRIHLMRRSIDLMRTKLLQRGATQDELDAIHRRSVDQHPDVPTVGSPVEWDDGTYIVEAFTPDGVVLIKDTRPTEKTWRPDPRRQFR